MPCKGIPRLLRRRGAGGMKSDTQCPTSRRPTSVWAAMFQYRIVFRGNNDVWTIFLSLEFDRGTGHTAGAGRRGAVGIDACRASSAGRREVDLAKGLHPVAVAAAIDGFDHHAALAVAAKDEQRAVAGLLHHG